MIKNSKLSFLEKVMLGRNIFSHVDCGSNRNCLEDNYFKVVQTVATKYAPQSIDCMLIRSSAGRRSSRVQSNKGNNTLKYFEPEVITQAIDYPMAYLLCGNYCDRNYHVNERLNPKHPQLMDCSSSLNVRGWAVKLVFDYLLTLNKKVSLRIGVEKNIGRVICKLISTPKSFNMVQARKETLDHVSVREKCLNYSCPNEFSVVGIYKAILKTKILSSLMHLTVNYKYRVFTYVSSKLNLNSYTTNPSVSYISGVVNPERREIVGCATWWLTGLSSLNG